MTAPDILLAQTAVQAIVTMPSPPIPVTTLTQQANIGDVQVHGVSFAGFPDESLLGFADSTGEDLIEIDSPTATTVNLITEGMGQTGLAHVHAVGTKVYCNIVDERLADPSPMLLDNTPLLEVSCVRQEAWPKTMPKGYRTVWPLRIMYTLRLEPPANETMNRNLWAIRQQRGARQALENVAAYLKGLSDLPTAQLLFHLGDGGTGGSTEVRDWSRLVGSLETLEFSAYVDLLYYTDIGYQ